jgi:hypothetical protein
MRTTYANKLRVKIRHTNSFSMMYSTGNSTHNYDSLGGATALGPAGWEPGLACAAAQSQHPSSGAGSARGRPQKPASAPDRVSHTHRQCSVVDPDPHYFWLSWIRIQICIGNEYQKLQINLISCLRLCYFYLLLTLKVHKYEIFLNFFFT